MGLIIVVDKTRHVISYSSFVYHHQVIHYNFTLPCRRRRHSLTFEPRNEKIYNSDTICHVDSVKILKRKILEKVEINIVERIFISRPSLFLIACPSLLMKCRVGSRKQKKVAGAGAQVNSVNWALGARQLYKQRQRRVPSDFLLLSVCVSCKRITINHDTSVSESKKSPSSCDDNKSDRV